MQQFCEPSVLLRSLCRFIVHIPFSLSAVCQGNCSHHSFGSPFGILWEWSSGPWGIQVHPFQNRAANEVQESWIHPMFSNSIKGPLVMKIVCFLLCAYSAGLRDPKHPPFTPKNGTDELSGSMLEPTWLCLCCLIPGAVVHFCMSYVRANQTIYNVAPAVHDVVMKGMGGNWGYVTRCVVHTNEGPHPSCQRVRLFYKRPPDGPQWPSVTPEKKLGCYENDIP